MINDGVHIYTLAYQSFHLGTELMSNHGGVYNKCFLCCYLAHGILKLDRGVV
jgi:hypothetical protein